MSDENINKRGHKGLILFFVFFAFCFVFLIYTAMELEADREYNRVHVKGHMESQGFSLVMGRVDSPSVVIEIKNLDAFLTKAKELSAGTIYFNESTFSKTSTFYVFEENMLVSYYYTHLWAWPVE